MRSDNHASILTKVERRTRTTNAGSSLDHLVAAFRQGRPADNLTAIIRRARRARLTARTIVRQTRDDIFNLLFRQQRWLPDCEARLLRLKSAVTDLLTSR